MQRIHGDEGVAAVGRADVDRIQIELEQFLIIGENLRILGAVILLGLFGALDDQVAESNHLHIVFRHDFGLMLVLERIRQTLDGGHVLAVGDTAAANDTNLDDSHVDVSFRNTYY